MTHFKSHLLTRLVRKWEYAQITGSTVQALVAICWHSNGITARRNIRRIWNANTKKLMKRAPGNLAAYELLSTLFSDNYSLRPKLYSPHFTDGIFKCIVKNWYICVLIDVTMKCVPLGTTDNDLFNGLTMKRQWFLPESTMTGCYDPISYGFTKPQWVNTSPLSTQHKLVKVFHIDKGLPKRR